MAFSRRPRSFETKGFFGGTCLNSTLKRAFFSRFVLVLATGYLCTLTAAFFMARHQAQIEEKVRVQQLLASLGEKKDKLLLFYVLEDANQFRKQVQVIAEENSDFAVCADIAAIDSSCRWESEYVHPSDPRLKIRYEMRPNVRTSLVLSGILTWPNIIILMFVTILGVLTHRFINTNILKPIENMSRFFSEFSKYRHGAKTFHIGSPVSEWKNLEGNVNFVLARIRDLEAELVSNTKFEIARQVAHDIRSPLTALNLVSASLDTIPDEKRIILRSAVQRINDIASSLLTQSTQAVGQLSGIAAVEIFQQKNLRCEMVAPLLESVVSEKRVQFGDMRRIKISTQFESAYGLFSWVDSASFKRAISNLLSNALEASLGEDILKVNISMKSEGSRIVIVIKDDGRGMSQEVLDRLGERNFSIGKPNSPGGHGLGVHYAKSIIEKIGGHIKYDSQLGVGTKVRVEIPMASQPKWFAEKIELKQGGTVVSLDDDETIHQTWSQRFLSVHEKLGNVRHLRFLKAVDLEDWVSRDTLRSVQYFFVDFELSGQSTTGLDVVERLCRRHPELRDKIVLVTSRHEEEDVKSRCEKLEIKILPKNMVNQIPIGVA